MVLESVKPSAAKKPTALIKVRSSRGGGKYSSSVTYSFGRSQIAFWVLTCSHSYTVLLAWLLLLFFLLREFHGRLVFSEGIVRRLHLVEAATDVIQVLGNLGRLSVLASVLFDD